MFTFKTYLIGFWMLVLPFTISAQGCSPVKSYAFSRPFIPGNAIAETEPGGKPEDRIFIYQVYLETMCSQPPAVPVAWIKGKSYSTHVMPIPGNKTVAGVLDGTGNTAAVKSAGKNHLYLIEFQEEPKQQKLPAAYAKNAAANKIWLQLKVSGRIKMLQTPPLQMLQPQEVY